MTSGEVSSTARLVALGQVLIDARHPGRHLVPERARDLYETWLNRAGGMASYIVSRAGNPLVQGLSQGLQRLTIPGLFWHHCLRKRWIEARVRRRIEQGVDQLVIIGSGLDPLAVRLSEKYEDLTCVECDRPATQTVKEAELRKAGVSFLPIALGEHSLTRRLDCLNRFDGSNETLFVIEGVSMYLSGEIVHDLLEKMASVGTGNNECVVTVMDQRNESIQFHNATTLTQYWLSWVGEPFQWGCPRGELPGLLEKRGLAPVDIVGTDELDSDPECHPAVGEILVHAQGQEDR